MVVDQGEVFHEDDCAAPAAWINIGVLRNTFRDDIGEAKEGRGDGFALPINIMAFELVGASGLVSGAGGVLTVPPDGETKDGIDEVSITDFDLCGSLLRKATCENFLRDEGGEQKEGMDFSERGEVWRGKGAQGGEDMGGGGISGENIPLRIVPDGEAGTPPLNRSPVATCRTLRCPYSSNGNSSPSFLYLIVWSGDAPASQ
jgi:hypothetical protein